MSFAGVFNEEQKRSLMLLRLIWVALAVEIVLLGVIVYVILVGRAAQTGAVATGDQTLWIISFGAVMITAALGYFLRMQTYKKHWISNHIAREGYFVGNLLLFGMVEVGALVAVVCAYLAQGVGQELLPLLICLLVLVLNFPNGRPMLEEVGRLPNRLA